MAHEKQPRTFRIVHTQVGAWPAGAVVGEHHLEGSDINRLLGLGAITETNLPETDAAPPLNPDELARQNNERVAAAAKNNKGTDTFTGDDLKTMAQQPVPGDKPADKRAATKTIERSGGTEDQPTFGEKEHPLSYFDGKSDEQILNEDGIGPATLDKIRAAQRKNAK